MIEAALLLALLFGAGPADSPSEARFDGPAAAFGRATDCQACHPEQVAQWQGSAHAHASLDNPWYRSAFDALRTAEGRRASEHCGGCHDPLLLAGGDLQRAVDPQHALASEGVSCLVCHAIVQTGAAGNGDFRIDLTDLPDPMVNTRTHRRRMRPTPLQDGTVCRGCHKGFLLPETGNPTVIPGFDDWGAWQASGWAGVSAARVDPPGTRQTCVDCHLASGHGMPGGRTALAAQTGQLDAVQAMLRRAVKVWIPVARVAGERVSVENLAPAEGTEVELDVVVRNVGAGHRFPGGLADIQDVWLRLTVNGTVYGSDSADSVHFRSLPLDEAGRAVRDHQVHRIVTKAFDRTLPPGEASVVRVRFLASGGPVTASAEVMHRGHRPALAKAGCASSTPKTLDGCLEAPVTILATGGLDAAPEARFAHALAWSRGVQEEVGEALRSLQGRHDAAAEVLRARILGRQGRVDDALAAADRAGVDHPAVHRARGDAAMRMWQWERAAEAFEAVVVGAPLDPAGWRDLARSRGSLGHAPRSLWAAERGLALQPRDPSLLHSRALALQALGRPEANEAMERWLAHRAVDRAADVRAVCDASEPECWERVPIPVWRL